MPNKTPIIPNIDLRYFGETIFSPNLRFSGVPFAGLKMHTTNDKYQLCSTRLGGREGANEEGDSWSRMRTAQWAGRMSRTLKSKKLSCIIQHSLPTLPHLLISSQIAFKHFLPIEWMNDLMYKWMLRLTSETQPQKCFSAYASTWQTDPFSTLETHWRRFSPCLSGLPLT